MADLGEAHFGTCVEGCGPMRSALADAEVAAVMVRRVEDLEARRRRRSVREVRDLVARRIGTTTGTLRNIRKERRKGIPAWLMQSIRAALIDVLQAELHAIEHELHMLRAVGADPRSDAFASARARAAVLVRDLESSVSP